MRYFWVDQTKLIAAFAVISIHASSGIYSAFGSMNITDWWFANIVITLSKSLANPIFAMLSGYLILGRATETTVFFRSCAKKILPALIFWSIFYVIFCYIVFSISWHDFIWQLTAGFLLTGKTYFHLWYLSMFACMLCFAPFINQWICGTKPTAKDIKILFVLFALFMSMNFVSTLKEEVTHSDIDWFTNFAWYLTYFIAGHYLGKSERQKNIPIIWLVLTFSATLSICIIGNYIAAKNGIIKDSLITNNSGVLGFILAISAFCMFTRMNAAKSTTKPLEIIANTSFGIYLIHPAILYFAKLGSSKLIEATIPQTLISIVLTFVASAFVIHWIRKTKPGEFIT